MRTGRNIADWLIENFGSLDHWDMRTGRNTGAETLNTDKLPVMVCLGTVRGMVLQAQVKRLAG